jgi:hypothetical protein
VNHPLVEKAHQLRLRNFYQNPPVKSRPICTSWVTDQPSCLEQIRRPSNLTLQTDYRKLEPKRTCAEIGHVSFADDFRLDKIDLQLGHGSRREATVQHAS